MASLNKVTLIGNLGKDPESRYMPNGDQVTNITLATTETWKDKNSGEQKEATEWHRLVFFRRQAEIASQYLKKGSQIYIEGKLKTRKWQDKDGVDRYTTEIHCDEMKMLGKREGGGEGGQQPRPQQPQQPRPQQQAQAQQGGNGAGNGNYDGGFEDDIPF